MDSAPLIFKMKTSTIRVKEDLKMRLNQLKYKFGYETADAVIRKLLQQTNNLSDSTAKVDGIPSTYFSTPDNAGVNSTQDDGSASLKDTRKIKEIEK